MSTSKIRKLVSVTQKLPEVEWASAPPPDTRNTREILSISTASATYWASRSGTIYAPTGVDFRLTKAYTFEFQKNLSIAVMTEDGRAYVKPVAELVAEVFLPKPKPGQVLLFIDRDRMNCAADNLRWV
jgi:hypothetical protein